MTPTRLRWLLLAGLAVPGLALAASAAPSAPCLLGALFGCCG